MRTSAKAFAVDAQAKTTATLTLPRPLIRLLRSKGKVALVLRAVLHDPAGNQRSVHRAATTKTKARKKR